MKKFIEFLCLKPTLCRGSLRNTAKFQLWDHTLISTADTTRKGRNSRYVFLFDILNIRTSKQERSALGPNSVLQRGTSGSESFNCLLLFEGQLRFSSNSRRLAAHTLNFYSFLGFGGKLHLLHLQTLTCSYCTYFLLSSIGLAANTQNSSCQLDAFKLQRLQQADIAQTFTSFDEAKQLCFV